MKVAACCLLVTGACAVPGDLGEADAEQAATVCGVGPTVKGIDVSFYQGTIDWAAARADGVEYAFIRVSDGLTFLDSKFTANWAGAGAHGILRGAYQFFRPDQSAVAQADLLLERLAAVAPGELPPVIDVEAAGGLGPAAIEAAVRAWIDRVEPAVHRPPILYTGYYFWRDNVGGADLTSSPLWHAQYTAAACPTIADPWTDWAFWQYTSTGTVAGIAGPVDIDRWNGTRAQLDDFVANVDVPCGVISRDGGEVDDGDACFVGGGPPQFLRKVADAGVGGDLTWTHTTDLEDEANFGHWELVLAEAGRYRVEVSTPAPYAESRRARYQVRSAGETRAFVVDQAAHDGWQPLGTVAFAAGGEQWVHVADNTGEPGLDTVRLAIDAVRLVRVPDDTPVDPGEPELEEPDDDGGCAAGGGAGLGAALALALVLARRRRRAATPGLR